MSYLPSLPREAGLLEVFAAFPEPVPSLLDYHEVLLRGPSQFSIAERELIGAYTSGLNACGFCHGVHGATAEAFGIGEETLTAVLDDVATADIDEALKPVLRYVRKLTLTPSTVMPTDAQAVLDAGWSSRALHDVVSVCALFNSMNRIVSGLGLSASAEWYKQSAKMLKDVGYQGLKELLPAR